MRRYHSAASQRHRRRRIRLASRIDASPDAEWIYRFNWNKDRPLGKCGNMHCVCCRYSRWHWPNDWKAVREQERFTQMLQEEIAT